MVVCCSDHGLHLCPAAFSDGLVQMAVVTSMFCDLHPSTASVIFTYYHQFKSNQNSQSDVDHMQVFSGLLIGAMLPYWFSAMTMKSVGKAALAMVEEVRRQFATISGLMEGTARPDYRRCVEISTAVSTIITLYTSTVMRGMCSTSVVL